MAKKPSIAQTSARVQTSGPAQTSALARAIDLPPVIAQYFEASGFSANQGLVDVADLDGLVERFAAAERADYAISLWRGAHLHALSVERQGDFKSFCQRVGLAHSTARNYVSVYLSAGALRTVDQVAALQKLDFSARVELSKWTDAEREALAAGEAVHGMTIDDIARLSIRDFRRADLDWRIEHEGQLRKLRQESADAKLEVEKLKAENLRLLNRRTYAVNERALPLFARAAREEAGVLTEQMSIALEALRAVADEHVLAKVDHPEVHVYQPEAAATIYFALAGVIGRGVQLLNRIETAFPAAVSGGVRVEHQFSPTEIDSIVDQRQILFEASADASSERAKKRENDTQGKRGAKRK